MTITHTVRLEPELDRRLQAEARRRRSKLSDLWRDLVKTLPPSEAERVTNVEPLPEATLRKIYAERQDDRGAIGRMVKAQAFPK